jgi:hypothetical protein
MTSQGGSVLLVSFSTIISLVGAGVVLCRVEEYETQKNHKHMDSGIELVPNICF